MNRQALEQAMRTIAVGSKSFAAAARLFDAATRESAVLLYAWCRHCDDVIDGQQLGHGQAAESAGGADVLDRLEARTRLACTDAAIDDPVFAGLQHVVQRHGIPERYLLELLAGFRMDVDGTRYETIDDTLLYCYRVAGVVGIMMALVMGARRPATLDRACDLGLAFQLTNISRDVVEDAASGRVYLPAEWLREAGLDPLRDDLAHPRHREALGSLAARLVDLADPYYVSAVAGIGELPLRSAWSVATARGVYRDIGRKVKAHGAHAWDTRISTSRMNKLWLIARGAAIAIAVHGSTPAERPAGLWRRPE